MVGGPWGSLDGRGAGGCRWSCAVGRQYKYMRSSDVLVFDGWGRPLGGRGSGMLVAGVVGAANGDDGLASGVVRVDGNGPLGVGEGEDESWDECLGVDLAGAGAAHAAVDPDGVLPVVEGEAVFGEVPG